MINQCRSEGMGLSELDMEERLIEQLVNGESQWSYRKDIRTEKQLWENFKNILFMNNKKYLVDNPLTDLEFEQIKSQLNFSSPYQASVWLRGENGIAKVDVQRENVALGMVQLEVFRSDNISGGTSVYEVINQYRVDREAEMDRDRRFDVTLLINGLPMIQIELKKKTVGYMAAFEQIRKYSEEGKYRGIFSTLQMFIVSNGVDTKYIAAADAQHLNREFLTSWVDRENKRVNKYLEFAREVLSIPQAHKMVTEFSVLDRDKKAIILLRPYQIHAIQAVEGAVAMRQSGYVWHTTGSGKTLTSYKVARNLLRKGSSLDKTIFIVDRKDLDQQTGTAFQSYAENDVVSVDQTDSVRDLVTKLLSSERNLIVTTIQKLNHVMKRYANKEDNRNTRLLRNLNLGFVVDECHRAVSPEKQQEIIKFFPKSLWYGFTGTPIFAENARDEKGNLARTTEEQYGPRLHEYTVKEAIHDNAVLGFQVEYVDTVDRDSMIDYVNQQGIEEADLTDQEIEKYLPKEAYERDEHKLQVIDKIINNSRHKFKLNRGPGKTYSAILTTKSIPDAQRYYELFQQVIRGESSVRISEKTKRHVADFPKVTVTYSLQETEETSFERQEQFKKVMQDYNEMFNTKFDLGQIGTFNYDVNNRLARKRDIYQSRSEQIDIVIVVDRLLTGFDSPSTALLLIDRPPMTPQGIIQAFSRTNRIYDRDKRYGQVLIFEYPNRFQSAVEEAFFLYSNGGENEIQAPDWHESYERFIEAFHKLNEVAPNPDSVDMNDDVDKLKLFVNAYQQFDKTYGAIQVYMEYNEEEFSQKFGLNPDKVEDYHGKYENALEIIRESIDDDSDTVVIDFDYQLSEVGKQQIDYEYLMLLMQSIVNEPTAKNTDKRLKDVEVHLAKFKESNPKLGELVDEVWREALFMGTNATDEFSVSKKIREKVQARKDKIETDIALDYYFNKEDFRYLVDSYIPEKVGRQIGEQNLKDNMDTEKFLNQYRSKGFTRLNYWKKIKKQYQEIIEEEILPLNQLDK